jgi:anti-sigma factor RsiW
MNKQLNSEHVHAFSDLLSLQQMDCVSLDANKIKTGMGKTVFAKLDLPHLMEDVLNVLEILLQINLEPAVYVLYLDSYSTQLYSSV